AMASEKYATEDWLVRYQRNSSTGSYDAVLYSLKELQNADYNAKTGASLSGIKQYVFGETTESREIKNAQAKLTQDATGRYQTITIFNNSEISTDTIQADIRTDKEKRLAQQWRNQEPKLSDYVDNYTDSALYKKYDKASESCREHALDGEISCYKHVIAHMLDLSLNSDGSINSAAYPKSYKSSISNGNYDTSVTYNNVYISQIQRSGETPNMLGVSDAIRDGYQPQGKSKTYTITTSDYTDTSTETDKLLSNYYINQGNPNNTQILLSNYYVKNGEILNKTLQQKCIDLSKAIDMYYTGTLAVSDYSVFANILLSLNEDLKNFTLNDTEGYNSAVNEWKNNKPYYAEPVMGDINVYTTEGGTTYNLTCTTESDDIAYNQAMNQYYYDKAQYDQKVQEVNAKIEIIQVQDKNLELKLKQLDTEQNAIQTEMDAVKKVISKNVESSFKTFNA
ncbi:hypothetical protein IJ674_07775, partial [bacterium]|nr:hypothetical protein [bacterium]